MTYKDIIRDNCENHSSVSWWPKFAFHYTDISNAISILHSGFLYSRASATYLKVMKNDNASRQVIDMTNSNVVSKVRFYFRPLTPTQYYNEGYKHSALRYDGDENANVPIPIFLLFDLEKLLSLPGVQFSETSQAGHGSEVYSGVDAFSQLNFDYIYDNSYENFDATKLYRHAEITHPNSLQIDSCLCNILCRSSLERTTLLNLLRKEDYKAFLKYKDIIKVPKRDTFENNGLFIADCSYNNCTISISFSDTYVAKRYIEREMAKANLNHLPPLKVTIRIKWFNSRTVYNQEFIEIPVNILQSKGFTIKGLPKSCQAKDISIEVFFDDKLMCYIEQPLNSSELLK